MECGSRKALAGAALAAQGVCCLIRAHGKTNAKCYFRFLPFFIKAIVVFGYLSLTENGY